MRTGSARVLSSAPEALAPGARPRRVRRRWHWRRTLVATVVLYAVFMFARQEWMLHRLHQEEARYQEQLAAIEERNDQLRQELQSLQSLPAIEMQARAMGLTKPGEVVYEPVESKPGDSESAPPAAPASHSGAGAPAGAGRAADSGTASHAKSDGGR
ncbi:MAG: septum formation initiator family protein [Clostridia bacterium]|nr:septum formation initiator family protein [Clostridia bacterium]